MSNRSKRAKQFAVLSGSAMAVAPLLAGGHADAATFEVTNLDDSGAGSLRQAIIDANASAGADTITFAASVTGTITLSSQLAIDDSTTIVGPGSNLLTVSGNDASRVLYVNLYDENVTISGVTLTDGRTSDDGGAIKGVAGGTSLLTLDHVVVSSSDSVGYYGGGVYIENKLDLLVKNSTITGNTGTYGGGIYATDSVSGNVEIQDSLISSNAALYGGGGLYFDSDATLVITRSVFQSNTAEGGGGAEIAVGAGGATITDSTFVGNISSNKGLGGGLYVESELNAGVLSISGCTFSGNSSDGGGGGIAFGATAYGTVNIVNTTISGNTALYGGGIYVDGLYDTVSFTVAHSTITGNSANSVDRRYNAGGGIYLDNASFDKPGNIVLDHTVVAGNTASTNPGPDISAAYGEFVGNWSMVGDLDGFTLSGANNLPEGDALLGVLVDNGGLTKTHLPLAGSPLFNAGDPAFGAKPQFDQRGLARVSAGRIDVGAVEVYSEPVIPPTGSASGLLTGMGSALLAIGGAMHLSGRRRTRRV